MMPTGFVFIFQILVLVAALPVCALSLATSRGRRSQHRYYKGMAITLAGAALIGVLLSLLTASTSDDEEVWLEFIAPLATLLVCGLTIWRGIKSDRIRSTRSTVSSVKTP